MSDGKVEFDIRGNSSGLGSDLDKASSLIAKKTAGWTALGNAAVNGITNLAGKAADGVKTLISNAVEYNSQMQTYTTSFATMLGSAEAATAKVEELKAFAASTPFSMTDLAGATQTLLSFGIASDDASIYLKQLGDISQGDSQKLQSLTLAFAQLSSAGKLSGQDLLQMINAGFNPLQIMAEQTGASIGDLKEVMGGGKGSKEFQKQVKAAQKEVDKLGNNASAGAKMLAQIGKDGQISADMVAEAMRIATEEGGLFYGAMEKQSQTYAGQLSTLQDNLSALNADIFKGVFDALATDILPLANKYVERLQSAFDSGGLSGMLTEAKNILSELLVSIEFPSWEDIKTTASTWWTDTIAPLLKNVLVSTFGVEPEDADTLIATLTTFASGIVTSVEGLFQVVFGVLTGDPETIKTGIETWWSGIATSIESLLTGVFKVDTETAAVVSERIKAFGTSVMTLVGDVFQVVFTVLSGDEEAIKESITTLWTNIESAISGFFKTVFGIELPSMQGVINKINTWWSGIKSQIALTLGFSVEGQGSGTHDNSNGGANGGEVGPRFAAGGILSGTKRLLSRDGNISTVGEAGSEAILPLDILWQKMGLMLDSSLNAHLAGLEYSLVPELPSITLDIPPQPARQEDSKSAPLDLDYERLSDTLMEAMAKVSVKMDGQTVGLLVTPTVSHEIARQANIGRFR
ncbi:MAG: tape measure protein [Clostridia bacterium]|nr:tape measure protein [Clostridia bacterium]